MDEKVLKFEDVLRKDEVDGYICGVTAVPTTLYIGRAHNHSVLVGFCGFCSRGTQMADTVYEVVEKAKARWLSLKSVEADLSEAAKAELAELKKVFG